MMDSHLHTECSFDCVPGCSDGLGEWAMALGLSGFTVTDHLEIGVGQPVRFRQNLLDSLDYVRGLQKRFPMMDIGFGAELGQPHHDLREAAEAVSGLPLDFILASCHLVRGQPDFCDMAPGSYDPDALLEQYFREVLELVRSVDFDSLAHLGYPLRYLKPYNRTVDLAQIDDVFAEIMKSLVAQGKALELNTGGLRMEIEAFTPSNKYLQMYKDYGGEMITIGSDAECCSDIGCDIQAGLELLKSVGFKYFTVYKNRQPVMLRLL